MFTSNFAKCSTNPKAVAIAIGVPPWYKGRKYPALAPTRSMLKLDEAEYEKQYRAILVKLDAKKVFKELGADAILLCWEPFNIRCHRRLVAEWLEASLGVEIPELGFKRYESILFSLQKRKEKKKPAQKSLFDETS